MRTLRTATITGTGMAVPPRIVTNGDLEVVLNTSDEWIQQRTGIRERRHMDPDGRPTALAAKAARAAMDAAGIGPGDLDLVIVSTLSPEHYFPGAAAFLHAELGLDTTPAMDVRAQCSGFLYALSVGEQFIATGRAKRVLVCAVEVQSRGLDMSERGRDTAVLFGDGAGAVILEPATVPEQGIMGIELRSEGRFADKLWVEAPGTAFAPAIEPAMLERGTTYPRMDGPFVFKQAVSRLPEVIKSTLESQHLAPKDIDWWLFHQANRRINEMVAKRMDIDLERAPHNLDRYGNCSSASIPMLLDECVRDGRIRKGQLLCLSAFGSGFTWGSAIIRW